MFSTEFKSLFSPFRQQDSTDSFDYADVRVCQKYNCPFLLLAFVWFVLNLCTKIHLWLLYNVTEDSTRTEHYSIGIIRQWCFSPQRLFGFIRHWALNSLITTLQLTMLFLWKLVCLDAVFRFYLGIASCFSAGKRCICTHLFPSAYRYGKVKICNLPMLFSSSDIAAALCLEALEDAGFPGVRSRG